MKKLLKFLGVLLLLFFILLVSIPYLFKDDLFKLIQKEANKTLKGELVIQDLNVSLIRNFPNLSLTLDEVKFNNEAPFQKVSLFNIKKVIVEIDVLSAFSGKEFKINAIKIVQPKIDVVALADGTTNYDIMKESVTSEETAVETETEGSFVLQLDQLTIEGLSLKYNDLAMPMQFAVNNLNHQLSGNFSSDIVKINTHTTFKTMDFVYDGVPYLSQVEGNSDFDMVYNSHENSISFGKNFVELNRLKLLFEGALTMLENGYDLNLNYGTAQADFKDLMSFIPAVYQSDVADLKSSGKFEMNGNIVGKYLDDSEDYPALKVNMLVEEGMFAYVDLPSSLNKVNIDFKVNHPGGDLDLMKIDLTKFYAEVANNPINAMLSVSHPMTDPNVDAMVKGKLDLSSIKDFIPLEQEITGTIFADLSVKGRVSDFENPELGKANAQGIFSVSHLKYNDSELNIPILIDTLYANVAPASISIAPVKALVGESDFEMGGGIQNAMAYYFKDEKLSGNFWVKSNTINTNQFFEWYNAGVDTTVVLVEDTAEVPLEVIRIPENIAFEAKLDVQKLIYEENTFDHLLGALTIENGAAQLSEMRMGFKGGEFALSGKYNSVPVNPHSELQFKINKLPFAEVVGFLDVIEKYLPFAKDINGLLNTSFLVETDLKSDMMPDYQTLLAKGVLKTAGVSYTSEALQKANNFYPNKDISKVLFGDSDLSFEIENGMATIKPTKVKLGGQEFTLSGKHSIDQKLDYSLKSKVPVSGLKLPKELALLGIDLSNIDLELKVGGTIDKPSVKPVFGDFEVNDLVEEVKQKIIDTVSTTIKKNVKAEADKILADAQAQADQIMAEANKQVAALKAESDKQEAFLNAETDRLAKEAMEAAKGNPLKEAAAKITIEKLKADSKKKIAELKGATNKNADSILAKAQNQSDAIMADANKKAQNLTE